MFEKRGGCPDGCAYYRFLGQLDSANRRFYCQWYDRKMEERVYCPYFKDDGIDDIILELSGYYDTPAGADGP